MSWQEGVAVAVVLLGLGAGAFLVAQRPSFWIEFGTRLGKALLPLGRGLLATADQVRRSDLGELVSSIVIDP